MGTKRKAIIYGLGNDYLSMKKYIETCFEVIGYSDKNKKFYLVRGERYIPLEEISKCEFDYICITTGKFFEEIKQEILELIGNENENKVISIYDVIGDFRNAEVRHKWVINHLKQIPEGKILLDAGAGEQRYKKYCRHLKYVAQDFGKYIPNADQAGIHLGDSWDYSGLNIICDIIDIPLENESIDVILCTEVFEHLKNPVLAIKEFSRILRRGGILILTAPVCCLTHMPPYFYYNGFSEYWYKEHLSDNGFEIKEFTSNGNYFKYMSQELFRIANMAERYCKTELDSKEINVLIESIEIMMKLSEKDNGSDETLCFGKMLVAEKL